MCNYYNALFAALIRLVLPLDFSHTVLKASSIVRRHAIAPKMRSLIALLGITAVFATPQTPLTVNKHAWDAVPTPTVHLDDATFTGKIYYDTAQFLGIPYAEPPYVPVVPIFYICCSPSHVYITFILKQSRGSQVQTPETRGQICG